MEEKTGGRVPASSVTSISIELLRKGGPTAVCEVLCRLEKVRILVAPEIITRIFTLIDTRTNKMHFEFVNKGEMFNSNAVESSIFSINYLADTSQLLSVAISFNNLLGALYRRSGSNNKV